jgi:hypothetical protein
MLYSLTLFLALVRQLTFCFYCVEIVWYSVVGIMSFEVWQTKLLNCFHFVMNFQIQVWHIALILIGW